MKLPSYVYDPFAEVIIDHSDSDTETPRALELTPILEVLFPEEMSWTAIVHLLMISFDLSYEVAEDLARAALGRDGPGGSGPTASFSL